jgi:hypothetical protein
VTKAKFKTALRRPLVVVPYSRPYTHIVRFKNSRANLLKTFIGMAKGQDLLVRMTVRADRNRVQGAADNARVRIKIEEHPALDTVRVTSLGPQRERVMSEIDPGHVRYFKTRHYPPSPPEKPELKRRSKTLQPSKAPNNTPDIFS